MATRIDCDALEGNPFRAKIAVRLTDVYELFRLFVVQGAISWSVPSKSWHRIAALLGSLNVKLHPGRTERNLAVISAVLKGEAGFPDPISLERAFFAGRYEERFQYLRAYRPDGWHPVIRVHGTGAVESARESGRGIIFWTSNFAFNDLVTKVAWHRLGLEVSHFTRPVHGFSESGFGVRVLNPVRTVVEDRYLGERVSAENSVRTAMRVLDQRARAGGVISFTVGNRGRRVVSVPFLGGSLALAAGVPGFARRANAALHPTFTIRAPDNSFDVTIGEELGSGEIDGDAHARAVITDYANQLAPFVRAHPRQWRGWRYTRPDVHGVKTATG